MKKKILIIGSNAKSLLLFRYELMILFNQHGFEIYVLAPEDQVNDEIRGKLKEINVQLETYPVSNRGVNFLFDLKTIFSLYHRIKDIRPNIVLCYTIKPVIYGSFAAKLAGGAQIFSMITGLGSVFIGKRFGVRLARLIVSFLYCCALKFNKKVFFQNPDDRKFFIDKKLVSEDKTILINGSGVNVKKYSMAPIMDTQHFLFIGRLLRDKGIFEFLAAAKQVRESFPLAKFTIIGGAQINGSSEKILKAIAQAGVNYVGEVDEVRPYLNACGVYALPSYREGTPRSVLEAMSVGRPIITTDAPGCKETVIDGLNGFLVPVGNVGVLAEKMLYFLEHPTVLELMGRESRRLAEEKYDVHKVNACIFNAMLGN